MKKMILTMAAVLCMSTSFAKMQQPQKPTPAQVTEKMATELNLNKKQKAKVLALNEKYADLIAGPQVGRSHPKKGPKVKTEGCTCDQKQQKVDGQTGATAQQQPKRPELTPEQRAKMKAEMESRKQQHEAYDSELKKILTDKQFETYKKSKKKGHGHHGHHGPNGHGPHHGGPRR